mgnify:CR=1 FL=1
MTITEDLHMLLYVALGAIIIITNISSCFDNLADFLGLYLGYKGIH